MEHLKAAGVVPKSIGRLNGVLTWKITGNTKPMRELFKAAGGLWITNHWRLTDHQFQTVLQRVSDRPPDSLAKRQKVTQIQELKQRKQHWEALMASDLEPAYTFIMDKVFIAALQQKGESCWGSLTNASMAVHACGLNIVWEFFQAIEMDLDKIKSRDCRVCYGCGEAYS